MNCGVSRKKGMVVVTPNGRIDTDSARDFQDSLMHAGRSVEDKIELDFSAVSAITSSGLRVMIDVLPDINASRCMVLGASPPIIRLFQLAGLEHLVAIEGISDRKANPEISEP